METEKQAQSQATIFHRINTLLLLVVFLGMLSVHITALWLLSDGGMLDGAQLLKEIQQSSVEHAEIVQGEAQEVAAEVLPPLAEALYRQSREDYPRMTRTLYRETVELADDAQSVIANQVDAQYRDYLARHREVLAEEFPTYAGKEEFEQVWQEYERVLEGLIQRYHLAAFRQQSERTAKHWQQLTPLEISEADQPRLIDQFVEYFTDWSVLVFADETQERLTSEKTASLLGAPE